MPGDLSFGARGFLAFGAPSAESFFGDMVVEGKRRSCNCGRMAECTPGLEAMLKEFISTQTAFSKSVEEKLDKIDILASKVDRLASDVDLLKLKVMPNKDIDNKIVTTANAIQVRINKNIRLMAELHARWEREENEKFAKENNVAKVWTITTTSSANASHISTPPTINGKIIGVGNVSTPSAKRAKLPETAKTAETDKTAEIFQNVGDNDSIAVGHNDLDFDDCHISEVIKFLQKLAKGPNASAINLAFTKHITNALIKAREDKLKLETSIPRKLEDGWEPIIKMRVNDFDCNALCDLGASISVMPKKIYDMLDLPPLRNCYLDVNLVDNAIKKPLGRIDNVRIMVNNNLVPVDFVVLDIECNASCPIILGRPFLRTVGATIDMKEDAAAANPISGIQEIASGTLPERGIISGGLFIAMITSGSMCSTLAPESLEIRDLSLGERDLHARLKKKVIALAVVERARRKQRARITNIKEGDANTKFFHLRVNARRRKNHIYRLKRNLGWVTDHAEKEELVHAHFSDVIGHGESRRQDFMWDELHFINPDLGVLGDPITEEEVLKAINLMPTDKAPGPDGFTGAFFKKCWAIIKYDVMRVIHQFGNLHAANFH
ncbi:hypothetical protein QYE76_063099 [Lolium multiflorum]|uniref:Uncharacterized protein n=1 Tax=Lolium multiflorum TaxID=4521 RepID=A0AAD8S4V2_LOLMU|nr:hypothetical protein QYE76_063099 [Lolium multiflorum]